jgi:hypothetical protein
VLVEPPANQYTDEGERHDAEDPQPRHGMTATTQAAAGSSSATVFVHMGTIPPFGGKCSSGRSWRARFMLATHGECDNREILCRRPLL